MKSIVTLFIVKAALLFIKLLLAGDILKHKSLPRSLLFFYNILVYILPIRGTGQGVRLEGRGYFLIRAKTQVANLVENWEGVNSFFSVPVMKPNGQRHLREGEF